MLISMQFSECALSLPARPIMWARPHRKLTPLPANYLQRNRTKSQGLLIFLEDNASKEQIRSILCVNILQMDPNSTEGKVGTFECMNHKTLKLSVELSTLTQRSTSQDWLSKCIVAIFCILISQTCHLSWV